MCAAYACPASPVQLLWDVGRDVAAWRTKQTTVTSVGPLGAVRLARAARVDLAEGP